jgi:hypothetical protein
MIPRSMTGAAHDVLCALQVITPKGNCLARILFVPLATAVCSDMYVVLLNLANNLHVRRCDFFLEL